MIKKAYGKVNLALEIVGKEGNYHLLEIVVSAIDIYDTLTFKEAFKDEVSANIEIKDNNILKAIKLFKEETKVEKGVAIELIKRIPIGYGLGSSRADISATLLGLNELFKTNLSKDKLKQLAGKLGSDTVFSLENKRAFLTGRGEKVLLADNYEPLSFLIILPKEPLLTKTVFNNYQFSDDYFGFKEHHSDNDYLIKKAKNDLLKTAINLNKEIKEIIAFGEANNIKINLTGAGSGLFVINPTLKEIKLLKTNFKECQFLKAKEL